ncbi:MAG: hypothetical protein D6784_04125 [Chloroflexi bacterium]|nr:MAG: hypothetical protein D6784_04125 [Chloroflexota bacterium]
MKRQHIIAAVAVALVLLIAGLGVLAYALSQGAAIPGLSQAAPTPTSAFSDISIPENVQITPPPSLAELADQIRDDYPKLADLLENPKLGSVYKDFYLAYTQGGKETALALARQRGILNDKDEVVMTLVLDTEDSDPLVKELEAEGVIIKARFGNKINIAIPVSVIQAQIEAEEPDLILDRLSNLDHVVRIELPFGANPKRGALQTVQGQGVQVTMADKWHAQGITGKGVKVGVLDLGFAGYQNLLGKELPENVTVQVFGDDSAFTQEVHGTACAEIVHEMAPDAELYLAYYDGSDAAMGQAVEWLIQQGVDIISNSTGSSGLTPLDGSGFSAEMADWAYQEGILWVNAAGNEADVHYRGQFTDTNNDTIHEFLPGRDILPFIPAGPGYLTKIIISWNDWKAVDQDYDAILLDKDLQVLAKSEEPQSGEEGQLPLEGFIYEFNDNEIYYVAIINYENKARGDAVFDVFVLDGLMHPDFAVPAYSLGTPGDARGSFTVGAVNWENDVLEPYSSNGPTADGRLKPDISAPSVVSSASYAPEPFNGTSAAAPHVSGAAALVKQAFPEYGPNELAQFLLERAIDLGPSGPDNAFGVGRLSLGDPPTGEQLASAPAETPAGPTAAAPAEATPVAEATAEAPQVGLPSPGESPGVGLPTPGAGQQPGPPPSQMDEDTLGLIVVVGLCLVCLAGLLFLVVIILAVMVMRRR